MGKARTKAQRRGRPRKNGSREANGRPKRESVAETRSEAIQARMRQHGLTVAQSGERLAGYEIGRLYLRRQLDLVDVEVSDDYVQRVADFMSLTNPQQPFPKAIDYIMTVRGQGGEPSQDAIDRVRSRYIEWNNALKDCRAEARVAFHGVAFFDKPSVNCIEGVKECIAALRRKFR